jgi:hydroxyacylglutathione hydrolase
MKSRRAPKIVALVVAVLAALAAVAVFALRASARKHGPAEPVAGAVDTWRVHNGFVDLYAAKTDDGVLVFDTGADATGGALDALLAPTGGRRSRARVVFLTHGHFDHIAAVPLLAGTPVYAGRGDAALMRGEGGKLPVLTRLLAWIFAVPPVLSPPVLDKEVEIPVSNGRESVVALPAPGHTAGSFLYFFRGVLFVGDAIDVRKGALALPEEGASEDPPAVRRTIADLPRLLTGLTVNTVCTGHGGCTPPAATRALLDDLVRQAAP